MAVGDVEGLSGDLRVCGDGGTDEGFFFSKIRVERDKRGFCERGRVNSEKKWNESGVKRGFIFLLFLFFSRFC